MGRAAAGRVREHGDLHMKRFFRYGIIGLVVLAVVVVAVSWMLHRGDRQTVQYRTAPVKRGDLASTIGATGTVEPEEVVDVGAQVAGRIVSFGKDQSGKTIDYGSVVETGSVLAQIDDALYAADVGSARAQVEEARAAVVRAEADLTQYEAKLFQAERDWARAKKLGPSEALSQSDFDAAQSAYEVARANVGVGKAAIAQARSTVVQAEAVLKRAQQNLDYCTIISPVRGVIIDRRVNIGQTVVSSLNAPSLFLIAKDLKRMQVWIAVNEADIGNIHPGQPVNFTVDAYPGEAFQGEVGKIRLNATMTQNVVTYTVEVITDNSSGKLLPYLTANAKFLLNERHDVLMVPNAALRWGRDSEQAAGEGKDKPGAGSGGKGVPPQAAAGESEQKEYGRGVVWVPDGPSVKPLVVRVGLSDGNMSEVRSEELKEGMQVVVGEQPRGTSGAQSASSPFTPQLFRGGRPH